MKTVCRKMLVLSLLLSGKFAMADDRPKVLFEFYWSRGCQRMADRQRRCDGRCI